MTAQDESVRNAGKVVLASVLVCTAQARAAETDGGQPLFGAYVPGMGLAIWPAANDTYQLRVGLQAAYRVEPTYFVRKRLDAAVQGNWVDPSKHLSNDRYLAGQAQVTYDVKAPILILKLRYAYADQQTPGMTALGSVKLPGTAGRTQLITFQINLAF